MKTIAKLTNLFVAVMLLSSTIATATTTEWAKSFGGDDNDQPYATAVDANGNLFVLTKYNTTCDFDPNPYKTVNVTPTSLLPSVALSKYDANGTFLWVKSFSANVKYSGSVLSGTMVVDKAGNVYFGGEFSGTTDFNPDPVGVANLTPEAITPAIYVGSNPKAGTYEAFHDAFVCKLDNNGNFVWVKQFRGDLNQEVLEISVDDANNVFIASDASGQTSIQTDFNPDPTATAILTNTSNESLFITKLDANGNYLWTKQLQGSSDRYCYGIKTDKDGNIYLGGHFLGTIYPDPSSKAVSLVTYNNNPTGTTDLFFIKWDAFGNYVWSKSFGGTGYDVFGNLDIDPTTNSIYITGEFGGVADFNMNPSNAKTLTSFGGSDGFLAKYDAAGNCEWVKQVGGSSQDKIDAVSLDALGNLFIGGYFSQTVNFDPSATNITFTSAGNYDAFIAKLDNNGNFKWVKQIGSMGNDWTGGLSATGDGNVFASGSFTFDASISNSSVTLTAINGYDTWLYKSSATTDIKELKFDASISVYPNPTFGKATVNLNKEYSHMQVTIRNIIGGEVLTSEYNDVSSINLNLPKQSGVYLVDLKNEKGHLQTLKVVKR
ncbi:MAG: SBBP repeat-containing protein [Bacteroidales bacterium]|nr:SBBP repeat-containing protein [Bacteroidales bacterium]